jgi:transcriptional regulator with XRE-family HTH domain
VPLTGLGPALRSLRDRKRLTQRGLASVAGLSEAGISKIENGIRLPDCGSLQRILLALDADVHDLAVALDEVNGRVARVPPAQYWLNGSAERVRLFRELASLAERLSTLEDGGAQETDLAQARIRKWPD